LVKKKIKKCLKKGREKKPAGIGKRSRLEGGYVQNESHDRPSPTYVSSGREESAYNSTFPETKCHYNFGLGKGQGRSEGVLTISIQGVCLWSRPSGHREGGNGERLGDPLVQGKLSLPLQLSSGVAYCRKGGRGLSGELENLWRLIPA